MLPFQNVEHRGKSLVFDQMCHFMPGLVEMQIKQNKLFKLANLLQFLKKKKEKLFSLSSSKSLLFDMHTADAFILRIDFLCHIIARAMATSKLSLDHMMVTWLKRNNQESVVFFFFLSSWF